MTKTKAPIVVYAVFDANSAEARKIAEELFNWFALLDDAGDPGAGLPVYVRCLLKDDQVTPGIDWEAADHNILVVIGDETVVGKQAWQQALARLLKEATKFSVVGVDLTSSLGKMEGMEKNLLSLRSTPPEDRPRRVRRTVSEVIIRELAKDSDQLPVFVSHAKLDGRDLAVMLRDNMKKIGQLSPWFDENDLPIGREWPDKITGAASAATMGFVSIVTDAYPTRPWCRFEITQARTPRRTKHHDVWTVQPVVSVRDPRDLWSRDLPMLESVPHIGWPTLDTRHLGRIADVVDRLLLEAVLILHHRLIAEQLAAEPVKGRVYLTWVPDSWTVARLLQLLKDEAPREFVYPGYGLRRQDELDLQAAVPGVKLRTYEEVIR